MADTCTYPQDCDAAEVITGIRVDIGGMRGDIRTMTQLVGEYVKRLDSITQDHEDRIRILEETLAQMKGRDRTIGYLKDILIAAAGALGGYLGGKGLA